MSLMRLMPEGFLTGALKISHVGERIAKLLIYGDKQTCNRSDAFRSLARRAGQCDWLRPLAARASLSARNRPAARASQSDASAIYNSCPRRVAKSQPGLYKPSRHLAPWGHSADAGLAHAEGSRRTTNDHADS